MNDCCSCCDLNVIRTNFENKCDECPGDSKLKLVFSSVLDDYLETVPHLHPDRSLTEDDLYFNALNLHVCEICGNTIYPGDPAYFRTDPSPTIRHKKCSLVTRSIHEYAYIEYLVNEIEYHEEVFRFNECCDYKLFESPGITLNQHRKYGYGIDQNNNITKIPHFGEFVIDYISGVDDYELIRKYRPYHVYIEFMLKAIKVDNDAIKSLGGYKYLLRENICHLKYPEITEKIDGISLSELMFDDYIHKIISIDMINIIYDAIFRKIFQTMEIWIEDCLIDFNGISQSYAINDKSNDADISIIIDGKDIYCVDFEKSLPFEQYFDKITDEIGRLLDYCRQFEVDV